MNEKNRQKKKQGGSVQTLIGIKGFSEYGLLTNDGELLFFSVTPTNISVLSATSIETKIRRLMVLLSAVPDLEIVCTDSAECFDDNKTYLTHRMEEEANPEVKELLRKDILFLDGIQQELSTARQFLFLARCRNMNAQQVFARANAIQKVISEQGFEGHRLEKEEIKRFLALYFDATLFGEQLPDIDGSQYFRLAKDGAECVKIG